MRNQIYFRIPLEKEQEFLDFAGSLPGSVVYPAAVYADDPDRPYTCPGIPAQYVIADQHDAKFHREQQEMDGITVYTLSPLAPNGDWLSCVQYQPMDVDENGRIGARLYMHMPASQPVKKLYHQLVVWLRRHATSRRCEWAPSPNGLSLELLEIR